MNEEKCEKCLYKDRLKDDDTWCINCSDSGWKPEPDRKYEV